MSLVIRQLDKNGYERDTNQITERSLHYCFAECVNGFGQLEVIIYALSL